jgi:hypothetical protein
MSRMARLRVPARTGSLSTAAPSTVSLMVAIDAFVANYMFLLGKNRRFSSLRIHCAKL